MQNQKVFIHIVNLKNISILVYYIYRSNYGTIEQRLGSDSSKPFENCNICLQHVINPMCWYFY